jgi:hypothetical protein
VGIYKELSKVSLVFKSMDRLFKLSQRPFEYFLLCLLWQRYQLGAIGDTASSAHYFVVTSERLMLWIQEFPDEIIPPHRKKQSYLSSILSKNEVKKNDPYNRGLFVRKSRGEYLLNPDIAFELSEDEWVGFRDFLRLKGPLQRVGVVNGAVWLDQLWKE